MIESYRKISGVEEAAVGAIGNELTFDFLGALNVIALCSSNEIAVLGLELLEALANGYAVRDYSYYDREEGLRRSPSNIDDWAAYVRENNSHAEKFVRQRPAGKNHVYILTTLSWNESRERQAAKRL